MTDERSGTEGGPFWTAAGRRVRSVADAWFSRRLQGLLARLRAGEITIVTPDGRSLHHRAPLPGPTAALQIHEWRSVGRLVAKGDLGFAEGYIAGEWSTPDLAVLLEFGVANQVHITSEFGGISPLKIVNWLRHRLRANTKSGSRRNIPAHYDLGNEFYSSWLDRSMTYSSAYFATPAQTLEEAQIAKQDLAIAELRIEGGERVLEIGCGWGGLAERIAGLGCHVTALTLSPAQLDYTRRRVEQAGLGDKVDVRLQDYRDVTGTFDRIVSIEMIEAVGESYWPSYFATLRNRLTSQGRAVLQAITIPDERFESYRNEVDFIQRYVFPGGMLPSPGAMRLGLERAGLVLSSVETFGQSYSATLAEWNRRFQSAWPGLRSGGMPDRFKRLWEYYLVYCEVGFRTGAIDVGLYSATVAD